MKKGLLLAVLFVLGIASAKAQAFFSTDKAAFFDELTAYLNTSTSKQDRDEAAAMMQSLSEVWNTYYGSQDAATVIRLCELYHAKSGSRAYANIFNFTELVLRVPASGLSHQDVSNWLLYTESKAQKSMMVTPSGMLTCDRLQLKNALVPMWVTVEGMLACVRLEQPSHTR